MPENKHVRHNCGAEIESGYNEKANKTQENLLYIKYDMNAYYMLINSSNITKMTNVIHIKYVCTHNMLA